MPNDTVYYKYEDIKYKKNSVEENESILDKIDLLSYAKKHKTLKSFIKAVKKDFNNTDITNNDICGGKIFCWLDGDDIMRYMKRRYDRCGLHYEVTPTKKKKKIGQDSYHTISYITVINDKNYKDNGEVVNYTREKQDGWTNDLISWLFPQYGFENTDNTPPDMFG